MTIFLGSNLIDINTPPVLLEKNILFSQRVACFKYSAETEPVPTIPVVPKEPPHKESTFLY